MATSVDQQSTDRADDTETEEDSISSDDDGSRKLSVEHSTSSLPSMDAHHGLPGGVPTFSLPGTPVASGLHMDSLGRGGSFCLTRQGSRTGQSRPDMLRELFKLPATEPLLDDYVCALRKRVLVQGRLYVFGEHLAFYSNLFGYRKKLLMRLADVVLVKRCSNVGFPNSVKMRMADGTKYFFTSFLSREEAYRLIVHQWRHCSEHAKQQPDSDREGAAGERVRRRKEASQSFVMTRLLRRVTRSREGDSSQPTTPTLAAGTALGPSAEAAGAMAAAASHARRSSVDMPFNSGGASSEPSHSENAAGLGSEGRDSRPASSLADREEFAQVSDQQCEQYIDAAFSAANSPAPPLEESLKPLADFELPCSPSKFWLAFLANHSNFFVRFHLAQGHYNVQLGQWQQHYAVGMVRDLQFVKPLKMKMGPPQTLCNQMQRYQIYALDHLVFETSQVQPDVPYGDTFKVETRWDVTPLGAGRCRVSVSYRVPFSKHTLWKKFIEKGVAEELAVHCNNFKEAALQQLLEQQVATAGEAGPSPVATMAGGGSLSATSAGTAKAAGTTQQEEAAPAAAGPLSFKLAGQPAGQSKEDLGWSRFLRGHGLQLLLCTLCFLILVTQFALLWRSPAPSTLGPAAQLAPAYEASALLEGLTAALGSGGAGEELGSIRSKLAAAAALAHAQGLQRELAGFGQQVQGIVLETQSLQARLERVAGGVGELIERAAKLQQDPGPDAVPGSG